MTERSQTTEGTAVRQTAGTPHASYGRGFWVKLVIMAIINAVGVMIIFSAAQAQSWGILAGMAGLLIAADWVYFSKRALPLKYILPGFAFLLVYQVFVVLYTAGIAFTNYGTGHIGSQQDAADQLVAQNEQRVEGSESYPVAVVLPEGEDGGLLGEEELGFAVVEDSQVLVGTAEQPLRPVEGAEADADQVTSVPGYQVLDREEVLDRQTEVAELRVPFGEDEAEGALLTQDGRTAHVYEQTLVYDEEAETLTHVEDGTVYSPTEEGLFAAEDGTELAVGWRVFVGFDNFVTGIADTQTAGPFFEVLAWTFVFALASVVLTYLVGMFLAIAFQHERLRGRKIYRVLVILPYAFPGFLSALLFAGMLNERFGFVNEVLLGGASIPWLTDPWLAKLSIILVNTWLGFPYMFLVCMGALQSIPKDTLEAASIDGAGALRRWWSVTLPMLMVPTAPLLIATFAFNFNNFNLVYMLTGGGPRMEGVEAPVGHTDILITMVFKISGLGSGQATDYGLAAAMSLVIFLIVTVIAVISFRRTRSLEEIN